VAPFYLEPGADLEGAVAGAVEDGRVVVAGGGDGTVNAVTQHLVGRGTLGVLPGGTRNHFARDLGMATEDDALDVLAAGHTRRIDVGRAGDRVFVNNAGMGLYPEIVREREHVGDGASRPLAALAAAIRVLRRSRPLAGTVSADSDARALMAWILFVGNNRFGTIPGTIGRRERLDEGVLDLALLTAGPRGARRASLAWRVVRSRPWETSRRVVRRGARRVEVRLEGQPRLVSWDGEAGDPTTELVFDVVPKAVTVVTPPE
jgi:diacylglycerol kinase family enzyme